MEIKNRLAYWYYGKQVLSEVYVVYDFISNSAKRIYSSRDAVYFDSSKLYGDIDWINYEIVEKDLNEKYGEKINKLALKKLRKYRKKKKIILENGAIIPGDYIVKCTWKLIPKFRDATFEEFKDGSN